MFSSMNKVSNKSMDIHKEKLKALRKIMPQLFNEDGTLNFKEIELLSKGYPSNASGKYEFNWAGKISAKRNAYKPSRASLRPDKKRSIGFDSSENMIIEGDNLEVLKLLQKSYSGKIKCIYIDPPYNTGNDFVYSDNYSEDKKAYWEKSGTTENGVKIDTNTETQGRYHSNWLNMMYPRLVLARELLKDDGVIFVSIDDNEVHNLRKIMDEIFGEENFVAQIAWRKSDNQANIGNIARVKEYILFYSKNREIVILNKLPLSDKALKEYRYKDNIGGQFRRSILLDKTRGRHNYEVITPSGKALYGPWMIKQEEFNQMSNDGGIYWTSGGEEQPYGKIYLKDTKGQIANDFWDIGFGTNQRGSLETEKILSGRYFDFPKPSSLIRGLLTISTSSSNEIIIDFFGGSGTTAHAVMDLNKEDGGNRKYILVQLPELTDEKSEAYKAGYKTISDICIERVKRVSEKIKKEDDAKLLNEGNNLDLGFKVFTLAPSFFPENQFTPDPEKSEEENIKALNEYLKKVKDQMKFTFEEEELLYEIAVKDGFKLTFEKQIIEEIKENKVYKISDGEKEALVCLDDSITNTTLKILESMKDIRFICLERAVDTTKKWNLKSIFGQNLWVA